MNEGGGTVGWERVVANPLAFKSKLRIGRDAYTALAAKENLLPMLLGAGGAGAGAGAASSSVVASTFFAPAGLAGWFGLATAVTPVGWILGAAVLSGGVFYVAGRWARNDSAYVDTIPKFISTPIDLLGDCLMRMMGSLAVHVAMVDGELHPTERVVIEDYLANEWGYDPTYLRCVLDTMYKAPDARQIEDIAADIAEFQSRNPDCNGPEMQRELLEYVREIVLADGRLRPEEEDAIRRIEHVFFSDASRIEAR